MKFLLHKGLGSATIRQVGDYLRSHGSGQHWTEKYRGDIFVNISDSRDEAILRNEFGHLFDPIDDPETRKP
jgi:hypothetical protein